MYETVMVIPVAPVTVPIVNQRQSPLSMVRLAVFVRLTPVVVAVPPLLLI